jgi:hypothetical protein
LSIHNYSKYIMKIKWWKHRLYKILSKFLKSLHTNETCDKTPLKHKNCRLADKCDIIANNSKAHININQLLAKLKRNLWKSLNKVNLIVYLNIVHKIESGNGKNQVEAKRSDLYKVIGPKRPYISFSNNLGAEHNIAILL